MDNLYYTFIVGLTIFLSFTVFVILITIHIVKKMKFNFTSYFVLLFSIVGMYLFVPSRFLLIGYALQSPDLIEKSIKLSIIPYEKKLAYLYLSDIYNYDIFSQNLKNGEKAITYLEKAINYEYAKYPEETNKLAILYSIQGNYELTVTLNEILNQDKGFSLKNIYIKNNEYDKALKTFYSVDNNEEAFLKADLYKKTGNTEESTKTREKAQMIYESNLSNFNDEDKRLAYIDKVKKYKSVEAYKLWLNEQAKEYKFINSN